jgi:hypothetical protein
MTKCAAFFAVLIATALGVNLLAQIDTELISPDKDLNDLYHRMASSRFILVGEVQKQEGVAKRRTPEIAEKIKSDLSASLGGSLYTIRVDHIICGISDFVAPVPVKPETPKTVKIFLPRDESSWTGSRRKEILLPGRSYLLLLNSPEAPQQKLLVDTFELDPQQIYFRAEEGNRGVIPLALPTAAAPIPKQPEILDKVTQLCQAMAPADVEGKLAALGRLAASSDAILAKEAGEAIADLRRRTPSP